MVSQVNELGVVPEPVDKVACSAPVSQIPSSSAFTLSFGGVDFRLTPEDLVSDSGIPMLSIVSPPNGKGKEMAMNLSSFTGTLHVSLSNATAMVESEPESPAVTSIVPKGQVSPFQEMMPFAKAVDGKNCADESNITSVEIMTPSSLPIGIPTVIPHSTGLPSLAKKDGQKKRVVPDIATNPVPSPNRQPKKPRGAGKQEKDQEAPTLGQTTQFSQSDPSQNVGFDEILTLCDYTAPTQQEVENSTSPARSSTLVQELVRQAESFSESGSVRRGFDESDDHSVDAYQSIQNDEGNSIMEVDDDDDNQLSTEGKVASCTSTTAPSQEAPTRKGQPPPSSRWGHTMTKIDDDRILVYGGQSIDYKNGATTTLSDISVYNMSKRVWYKPVNCEGVPRQWHSSSYIPERQLLISFGGESVNEKTGKITTTDQVMVLDTEIMLWYPPTVSGAVPSGRSGHTATLLPNTNELVVFGGVKGSKWQNSVAVLDISRWKWSSLKASGDAPRPRSYHSATALGGNGQNNKLIIFGGNDRNNSFNTIHMLKTDGKKWIWSHPKASGDEPPPRTGHCATLLEDKKTILIYGGWDPNADEEDCADDEMIFNDSYLLDTESWTWSVGPEPRFAGDGSSGSVSESRVENGGAKRVGHKGVLTNGEDGTQVLVFGGRIPNDQFASDFQTLTVPQNTVGFNE